MMEIYHLLAAKLATNAKISVDLASRTTASKNIRLELAFAFVKGAKCGAVIDGDLLALGNVSHTMHRLPSYAGVPRVMGVWYTGMVDPRGVLANVSRDNVDS